MNQETARRMIEAAFPQEVHFARSDNPFSCAHPKVTDLIRFLFLDEAKVPAEMVEIPDLPVRVESFAPTPGTSVSACIAALARDYLGTDVLWCPDRGRWVLTPL